MTRNEPLSDVAWEQALHSHLISHVEDEGELLDAYQRAADESHSAAFSYLVTLIISEERRHHAIFRDLATTLQTEVDRRPEAFAVPRLGHWGFDRERILELTEGFLAQENKDAAQLRELEAELGPVKETTMWPLLIRLMQADTKKHLDILHFIRRQVVRSWGTSEADWSGIEKLASSDR
jgi:hypothetical protein